MGFFSVFFHDQSLSPRKKCCLCLWMMLFIGWGSGAQAAPVSPKTFLKADYSVIAPVRVPPPNVLFLLDTGSPMVFSPKGIMPLADDGRTDAQRAELLRECTYGSGARPYNEFSEIKYWRYGRDVDNTNNEIGSADCYYSPDPQKPYFLTFKDKKYHVNLPSGVRVGSKIGGYPHYSGSPYPPQTLHPNYDDLVPNDSRMYMMKLVLWRLTSEANAELLAGMNIGMATSYQEDNYGTANFIADFYRYAPFGQTGVFKYGSAPDWCVGNTHQNYNHAQQAYCGILRNYYEARPGDGRWNQVNRAVLKVPFGRLYKEEKPHVYTPQPNLGRFRKYIDGVETANGATVSNPELFADGQTPLSTSIYARDYHLPRKDSKNQALILYSPKSVSYDTRSYISLSEYPVSTDTAWGDQVEVTAGQAVGSAIDFFAPAATDVNLENGLQFSHGKAGFFPVVGSCQSNWLVIFTAGNDEPKGELDGQPVRKAPAAALELYKNTQGEDHPLRGRSWDKKTKRWVERKYAMNKGIRTMVVGFADPTAVDQNSIALRKSLNSIAAHGQPKKVNKQWVKDDDQKALFANDVPGLVKTLLEVLNKINADAKASAGPSGAPLVQLDQEAGEKGLIFSSSYTPKLFDQWHSTFMCKTLAVTEEAGAAGGVKILPLWEAEEKMRIKGQSRPLYASEGAEGSSSLAVKELKDLANFKALTGAPVSEDAFRLWLYDAGGIPDGPSPLGDMQHSNFMTVSRLVGSGDVYLQTNRGVLHAIDVATGDEIWGFMPPNVFQGRIKTMKYDDIGSWYDGDGDVEDSRRSMPVVLLDGLLTNKEMSGGGRRVLTGTLGLGGNGLYAMDITEVSPSLAPSFLWAIENARYEVSEDILINGVRRWGNAAAGEKRKYDYSDLGLTIQAVSLAEVSEDVEKRVVGILPGGLGYHLGKDSQGKALFVLNPENGEILRKLDDRAFTRHLSNAPLGMALAPLTLVKDKKSDILLEFFTGDSEGNVLSCDVKEKKVENWRLKSLFRLTTVAGDGVVEGKSVAIPKAILWLQRKLTKQTALVGATSDVWAPGSGTDFNRRVHNDQQFIFCLRLERLNGGEITKDLVALTSEDINKVWSDPGMLSPDQKGWYLRLKAPAVSNDAEYATTSPYFYAGKLIVATFTPTKVDPEFCDSSDSGDAQLYFLDVETGRAVLKRLMLKDIKITGMTGVRGRLLFSVEEKATGAIEKALDDNGALRRPDSNILSLNVAPGEDLPLKDGQPYLDYWRDFETESLRDWRK